MGEIKVVVNENIGISEDVRAVIWLNFELYDSVHVPGGIIASDEITFFHDTSDPKAITGFAIKVKDPDEQMRKNAIKLGDTIVDYLSARTGVAVRSKRPKIENHLGATTTPSQQTTNTPQQQLPNFDLDASKLSTLLSSTRIVFNKRIHNYQRGLAALADYDIETAMAQFHQVIEDEPKLKQEDEYYMPLRNACDHHRIDNSITARAIRNFGIKCKEREPVDFTDVDNWQQLFIHAHALKQVADAHIKELLVQSNL